MTREETKEAIKVMQAYVDGKRIETKLKGCTKWGITGDPEFKLDRYDYRIKPEPHYRPFANAEEVMEAIKKHGDWAKNKKGCYVKVTIITQCQVDFAGDVRGFSTILNEGWTFADGTPFGKLEE